MFASYARPIFFPFLANALVTIVCSLNSTDYTHWVFQKDHILSLRFHVLRESVVQRMPPAARCAKRRAKTALNSSYAPHQHLVPSMEDFEFPPHCLNPYSSCSQSEESLKRCSAAGCCHPVGTPAVSLLSP